MEADTEFETWVSQEIDGRLDKLGQAIARGDDLAAWWQEHCLAGLTMLRRLRRAQRRSQEHGDG